MEQRLYSWQGHYPEVIDMETVARISWNVTTGPYS
ncbi:hypothetical protein EMIT047CA2_60015 [Pseudomonas soli]